MYEALSYYCKVLVYEALSHVACASKYEPKSGPTRNKSFSGRKDSNSPSKLQGVPKSAARSVSICTFVPVKQVNLVLPPFRMRSSAFFKRQSTFFVRYRSYVSSSRGLGSSSTEA